MIIPTRLPMVYKRTWSCFATPLAVPKIWRWYAIFWPLRHPRLAASATGSARRRSPARACLGQVLSNKKETVTKAVTVSFWQGQKDVNPRHAVLERKARFQLSRVSKYSPLKFRIKTALSGFESAVRFCHHSFCWKLMLFWCSWKMKHIYNSNIMHTTARGSDK